MAATVLRLASGLHYRTGNLVESTTGSGPGVHEQILCAARRLADFADHSDVASDSISVLRPEQRRILTDFARFLHDVVAVPNQEAASPFGRIILPPRTGKTVVAAHLIARTGLTATFIVPTRTLVEQTVREFGVHAAGVRVGKFYGECKATVDDGLNVTTYQMLTAAIKENRVPSAISASGLVFADEGHRAMTARRMAVLRGTFGPATVRVALTATPDYDDETRRLARFFPSLIHEMSAEEAQDLGILAPLRMWVAEVDANASTVRMVAGDYETESLGRLMSSAPFFQAALHFRNSAGNADRPCLVACSSRQQAHDLHQFLCAHRLPGSPAPALLLGSTPGPEREIILSKFAAGEINTIVQVGVLLEGWSSPRCKLLIDLAPSLSRVRATQKFFRVMTRLANQEARIYMLIPAELPIMPVLPMEVFGGSESGVYACGDLLTENAEGGGTRLLQLTEDCPVAGVRLKKRVVLDSRFARPTLDPHASDQIRAVLATCPDWHPDVPCSLSRFRWLFFKHELFVGRGDFLLRWLGLPRSAMGYATFFTRTYPEEAGALWLGARAVLDISCADEAASLEQKLIDAASGGAPNVELASALDDVTRVDRSCSTISPLVILGRAEERKKILAIVHQLPRRKARILIRFFGLDGEPADNLTELADAQEVSIARMRQLLGNAMRRLRRGCVRDMDESLSWRLISRPRPR